MSTIYQKCEFCEKDFPTNPCHKRKFCSSSCSRRIRFAKKANLSGDALEKYKKESVQNKNAPRYFEKECLDCKRKFLTDRKNSKYCSRQCTPPLKTKEVFLKTCKICNKEFNTEIKTILCCSKECAKKSTSKTLFEKTSRQERVCKFCSKNFIVRLKTSQIFCSKECKNANFGTFARNRSEETIKKQSESLRESYKSGKVVPSFLGKHLSEDVKKKISKKKMGKKLGSENAFFGKKHTDETKSKLSSLAAARMTNGYNPYKFFKNGIFFSNKNQKDIVFRSSWEHLVFEYLEKDSEVREYFSENLRIPYYMEGNKNYIPDLIIKYKNNKTLLVEIKPKCQIFDEKNVLKFEAARKYCKENDYTFEVWTEDKIKEIEKQIGKKVLDVRKTPQVRKQHRNICLVCSKEFMTLYKHGASCSRECLTILRKQNRGKI